MRGRKNKDGFLFELSLANLPELFGYGVGSMSRTVYLVGLFRVLSPVELRKVKKSECFFATFARQCRKRDDFVSKSRPKTRQFSSKQRLKDNSWSG
jgi:hypothetical protein